MSDELTVFVIDDEPPVVDSLCTLFKAENVLVEGFTSAPAFLDQYDPARRGCIVVDVRMPGMTGFELLQRVQSMESAIPVVMISASADVPMCRQALMRGAVHFLEKPFRPGDLIEAVFEAFRICRSRSESRSAQSAFDERVKTLTPDEYAVFAGLVAGQTNAKIAEELDISLRTMQFRRADMMRKLGANSKEELMSIVFRAGWSPLLKNERAL